MKLQNEVENKAKEIYNETEQEADEITGKLKQSKWTAAILLAGAMALLGVIIIVLLN